MWVCGGEGGWVTFVENHTLYQSKSAGVTWALIQKYTHTVHTNVCRHEYTNDGVRTGGHHNTLHYINIYICMYMH